MLNEQTISIDTNDKQEAQEGLNRSPENTFSLQLLKRYQEEYVGSLPKKHRFSSF